MKHFAKPLLGLAALIMLSTAATADDGKKAAGSGSMTNEAAMPAPAAGSGAMTTEAAAPATGSGTMTTGGSSTTTAGTMAKKMDEAQPAAAMKKDMKPRGSN